MISPILVSWLAVAAIQGAPESSACVMSPEGFCTGRVVRHSLSYQAGDPIVHLNVALGKALVIELAGEGLKLARDAIVGNPGLVDVKVPEEDRDRLVVFLQADDKSMGELLDTQFLDQRTNVQIDFEGRITLIVELRVGTEAQAVERLVLDFPERKQESRYVRERLSEGESRLAMEYKKKQSNLDVEIAQKVGQKVSADMLKLFECRTLYDRIFHDLVLMQAHRICRIGDQVYLEFSLVNRSRTAFLADKVEVRMPNAGKDAQTEVKPVYASQGNKPFLGYDGSVSGVISLKGSNAAATRFDLVVTEGGGRGRVLTLAGVGI